MTTGRCSTRCWACGSATARVMCAAALGALIAVGCFSTARSNRDLRPGQALLEARGPFVLGSVGDYGVGARIALREWWDALGEVAAGPQADGFAFGGTVGTRFELHLSTVTQVIFEADGHVHRTGDDAMHWSAQGGVFWASRRADLVPMIGVRGGYWTNYTITLTDGAHRISSTPDAALLVALFAVGIEWGGAAPLGLFLDLGAAWSPDAREAPPSEEEAVPTRDAVFVVVPTLDLAVPIDL